MRALDNRYLVARNIAADYVSTLAELPQNGLKGVKQLRRVLDAFYSTRKNVEGVVRDSLKAKGEVDPSRLEIVEGERDALYLGLLMRSIDDQMKTHLATSMKLEAMELPEFSKVLAALDKRLVAISQGKTSNEIKVHQVAAVSQTVERHKKLPGCAICKVNGHGTKACRKLLNAGSVSERIKFLRENTGKAMLCYLCLEHKFGTCDCKRLGKTCEACGGNHHKALCGPKSGMGKAIATTVKREKGKPAVKEEAVLVNVVAATVSEKVAMLGTLRVKVRARTGEMITIRVLADNGSTINMITTTAAQRLGLNINRTYKEVQSVDGKRLPPITQETTVEIQDVNETLRFPLVLEEVAVTKKIPLILPSQAVEIDIPNSLKGKIKLADKNFGIPGGIDMLFGTETWSDVMLDSSVKIGKTRFQDTLFGHVVQGSIQIKKYGDKIGVITTITTAQETAKISSFLRQIFEYEPPSTEEILFAENLFAAMVKRLKDGRYEVPLIVTYEKELGESYNVCFTRNRRVFEKFSAEQITQCVKVLRDYRDAGIITVVEKPGSGAFYNPIVPVWRHKSLTSPLRICLDGSQRTSSGVSGNDIQLAGPSLQPMLVGQLLKFRQHKIAIIADLAQMYLNISIRPEDRKYQRTIVNMPGKPVQEIEYTRVPFGAKYALFLAQAVIKKLAVDEKEKFPLACEILENCCYIDDVIFSIDNDEKAVEALNQLTKVTQSACFEMHKVASNVPKILNSIPEENQLSHLDSSTITKVLGISWDREVDEVFIKVTIHPLSKITKRVITSIVAQIYDPLGLISPVLLPAKLIIQEIWLLDRELSNAELAQSWDREVSAEMADRFIEWYEGLAALDRIRIKRHVQFDTSKQQSIVIFCDASTVAYGAVAYLRTLESGEESTFAILTSKSKVAPLLKEKALQEAKAMTIPRLELMAALVGASLTNVIRAAWELKDDFPILLFTDSEIVLARISSEVIVGEVFSENRLKKIRKLTTREQWFHIDTGNNPADLLSRGCDVATLKGMWMDGPKIMHDASFNPSNKFYNQTSTVNTLTSPNESLHFLSTSESFRRSVSVMAYVLRIVGSNCGNKPKEIRLLREELEEARIRIVKAVQSKYYADEIEAITAKKIVTTGSLRIHNPFLDKNGVLRVGTRLQQEEFDYNERNPVVLPPISISDDENHLSYQSIHDSHIDTNHGTISATMAHVRQGYFIPGLQAGVRRYIKACQRCQIIGAKTQTQIMGNIPRETTLRGPAFDHVTIDFMGPVTLSQPIPRSSRKIVDGEVDTVHDKCWVLIVACYATNAYHFEVVPSMEAVSFLRAFENFTSTRGYPSSVRSDNQTSFHRAKGLLKAAYDVYLKSLTEVLETIKELCTSRNILWSMNPPRASHFGGRHERGIRSLRDQLTKAWMGKKLSFVDMHACLKKIEAGVNSRPLAIVPGNLADGSRCLTPGHLMIGRPFTMIPSGIVPKSSDTMYAAYKIRQQINDVMWNEYHKTH